MAERDRMESGLYKEAMDNVRFSADFAERTIGKLSQELGTGQKRRRFGAPRRWAAGLGAVAAVALVGYFGARTQLMQESAAPAAESAAVATSAPQTQAVVAPAMPAPAEAATDMAHDERMAALTGGMYTGDAAMTYESDAYVPAAMNTAEYSHIRENGYKHAAQEPLQTFAADVDTASYANARQYLVAGELPPPDMVRTEEFLNYFRYDYPQPKAGEPFSITAELAPCPWNGDHQLMLVGLRAKDVDQDALPPQNLVFLIDVSGSMDEAGKLPLAQKAFRMLIDQLRPSDRVSIVTYAGADSVLVDGASGEDRQRIAAAIDSLFAGGSTDGASGIRTAYALAREHFIRGGNNRVILATDGDLNVGLTSEGELTRLIEEQKQSGVFLSVMGFGQDNLKDNKLEALADHGDGNYSYIDSALEARKVLVEELGGTFFTVAKDVKLQVEFNPQAVGEYRLIGYENRALAASDFEDDTKDGGEIGAGHQVTALFELIPSGDDTGSGLKYQRRMATGSSEYATVSVRAKAPDCDVSTEYQHPVGPEQMTESPSANLRFASAVAEVCMLLRDSEYKGAASFASAAARLDGIEGLNRDPYRDEFAFIVRKLARGA